MANYVGLWCIHLKAMGFAFFTICPFARLDSLNSHGPRAVCDKMY